MRDRKTAAGLVIGVIAVLAAAWWFWPNSASPVPPAEHGSPSMVTVTSHDGKATLSFPSDALPEGVSASDISVAKVPTTTIDPAKGLPATGYELRPEGLKLRSPATLSISDAPTTTKDGAMLIPLLLHSSTSGAEIIPDITVADSKDGSTVTVSGDVTHFSKVWVLYDDDYGSTQPFSVKKTGDRTTSQANKTFSVGATISHTIGYQAELSNQDSPDGYTYYITVPTDDTFGVNVGAAKEFSFGGPVSGKTSLPSVSGIPESGAYSWKGNFTCTDKGAAWGWAFTTVTLTADLQKDDTSAEKKKVPVKVNLQQYFTHTCADAAFCKTTPVPEPDGSTAFKCIYQLTPSERQSVLDIYGPDALKQ